MAKTVYTACGMRPEEVVICDALDAADYPEKYSTSVEGILRGISDISFKERVKATLGSFEKGNDGKLAQSSPFRLITLQQLLPQGKILVARPALQAVKQNNSEFMSRYYVECGLNLVPPDQSNDYQTNSFLARELTDDLREAGVDLSVAKLIPYSILTHGVNADSPTGLVFKLSEQGRNTAKQAVLNTSDFQWNYSPSSRGLFRACLGADGSWNGDGSMVDSNAYGRVVVETTSEAGSRELETLRKQAESMYQRQREEKESLAKRLLE